VGPSTFSIFRPGEGILARVPLDSFSADSPIRCYEGHSVGFQVEQIEADTEYAVRIGDIAVDVAAELGEFSAQWKARNHLDSCRGLTRISLWSRPAGERLARSVKRAEVLLAVAPTKLTEEAFSRMFEDMSRLSRDLLLDLLSKSHVSTTEGTHDRRPFVGPRSSHQELRILTQLWRRLAPALREIIDRPETALVRVPARVTFRGTQTLSPREVARLSANGIDPRRRKLLGQYSVWTDAIDESSNTLEHRMIGAFLELIVERAQECKSNALREIAEIEKDRWFRDHRYAKEESLYEARDLPRIARLKEASARASRIALSATSGQAIFPRPASLAHLVVTATPIFRNVRYYRTVYEIMRSY